MRQVYFYPKTDGSFFSLPGHVTQETRASFIYVPRLWDHKTFETPLLPKNASHQPPAIGISRNQGPTKQTNKNTTEVLPANHAPFPLKNYGPPMASSPDHEESKNQTILGTSGPGPPSFHERWVAPDPKTIPRDPQETVPTSWLKVYQQHRLEVSAVGVQPGGVHLDSNLL